MAETFESMMNDLEKIVMQLDNDQVSLEDSIKLYEQGVALSKACQKKLVEAEKKISEVEANGQENE